LDRERGSQGWYRSFVERLDPSDRLGELLFGLIMVLTFTLGAGVELVGGREAARELLIAALGCNAAWGIIDAGLYLMTRLSERGRTLRLARAVQTAASVEDALVLVNRALEDRVPSIIRPAVRTALDRHVVEQIRGMELPPNRVTAEDLAAGVAVFWLVFLTALPAVVPFLFIEDARIALRSSNVILIGLLFYVGWHWAVHTRTSPWRTGLFVASFGVALVLVAIALGG
jgi:hypothetical protein